MAPRFVFGPLSPTQGPKSPKKWLFYHKSESGAESESDNGSNSNGWRSPMTFWGWLFFAELSLSHNSICNSEYRKNPPNCYQHLKVPCSGMPFFRQKKPTKQNKLKQNKTSTGTYYNTITIPEYTNTMVWDPSKGQNTQNRSFFERFQGPPWPPWSLSKVVIG